MNPIFKKSYSWYQLDTDWLWVISGGSGWFKGIADDFNWMALNGGYKWFQVVLSAVTNVFLYDFSQLDQNQNRKILNSSIDCRPQINVKNLYCKKK